METPGSPPVHRRFDVRGLITYTVIFSFLVMMASGAVMFLAPSGRVSREIDWTLVGLDRIQWQILHLSFAVVFIAMGLSHLACNWQGLLHHLRDRARKHLTLKWEVVLALIVMLWLAASAILLIPPAATLHDANEYFRRTFWIDTSGAGTTTSPSEPAGVSEDDFEKTDSVLPDGHPTIASSETCIDCHQP